MTLSAARERWRRTPLDRTPLGLGAGAPLGWVRGASVTCSRTGRAMRRGRRERAGEESCPQRSPGGVVGGGVVAGRSQGHRTGPGRVLQGTLRGRCPANPTQNCLRGAAVSRREYPRLRCPPSHHRGPDPLAQTYSPRSRHAKCHPYPLARDPLLLAPLLH